MLAVVVEWTHIHHLKSDLTNKSTDVLWGALLNNSSSLSLPHCFVNVNKVNSTSLLQQASPNPRLPHNTLQATSLLCWNSGRMARHTWLSGEKEEPYMGLTLTQHCSPWLRVSCDILVLNKSRARPLPSILQGPVVEVQKGKPLSLASSYKQGSREAPAHEHPVLTLQH